MILPLSSEGMKGFRVYDQVVLDLAMPGPERLAGEGVLMGAVPIVSER